MTDTNYIEGAGIAISAVLNDEIDRFEVEIANVLYGLMLAKGDLIAAADDATPARLPAGSDGQVLTADSTQAAGLKWAAGGAGSSLWIPLFDSPDGTAVLDTDHSVVLTSIPSP